MDLIYVVDTSSWIDLTRIYPIANFRNLWENLSELVQTDRIKAPTQVKSEIEKGRDSDLLEWCKTNKQMFVDDPQLVPLAAGVVHEHPGLVPPHKSGEAADPFLIALAMFLRGGISNSSVLLVTEENRHSGIKIPRIAQKYDIESIGIVELIIREGWEF